LLPFFGDSATVVKTESGKHYLWFCGWVQLTARTVVLWARVLGLSSEALRSCLYRFE